MSNHGLDARVRNLASAAGFSVSRHRELSGDVGTRRYIRLFTADERTAIAVVYPEDGEGARERWNRVRTALADRVRVPEILADDGERLQILEDFGDTSLASLWRAGGPAARRRLARRAARVAGAIAGVRDPKANPPFSADFFFAEMERTRENLFERLARLPLSPGEESAHRTFARALSEEISAHPRVFLHRDFHADNLYEIGGEIGVIDFQDARRGPDSYDLASLTRERITLLEFEKAAEEGAVRVFQESCRRPTGFRKRLRRVRLQRAWKAAGTFAGVWARRKTPLARRYLTRELSMVIELLGGSEAEVEFRQILAQRSVKLFVRGNEEARC